VTDSTVSAQGTFVGIIGSMAGKTIHGCAFEDPVCMALLTVYFGMRSCEREGSQCVVDGGILPATGIVARATILPKRSFVGVVRRVTGIAILWSGLQVGERARALVAASAVHIDVSARKGKCLAIVVKSRAVGIQAIVANEACLPKGDFVGLHVGKVEFTMAVKTNNRLETSQLWTVAVGADERHAIGLLQVGLQCVACGLVGKTCGINDGQRGIRPPVLRVAIATMKAGIRVHQHAV
jgi:hypothetical protein